MDRTNRYQALAVLLFACALFLGVPAAVNNPACGSMAEGWIPDEVEVPALGVDIASVQALENTDSEDVREAAITQFAAGAETLPVSYDARNDGRVTSVKNQEFSGNTCWAFSAVSMAESGLLANSGTVNGAGVNKDALDLAEMHLAYYFYHMPKDPLGNTDGDATIPLGDYLMVGGNHIFTTFALANWAGLAEEQTVDGINWENDAPEIADYPNAVHMQKAYWINLSEDVLNVKQVILEYGSAAISMYYSPSYYCESTASYHCIGAGTSVNHAVSLVGWDDTYSKDNFTHKPSQDGAWLAKNSYGSGFGDEGYFWISYEDRALTQKTAKAFVFAFEDAANYEYIYQYDGSAGAYMESGAGDTGYRVADGGSIANVFTVPADAKTGYQSLEAVSFALYAVNVDYSVQIYRSPSDAQNPCSGTAVLPQPVQGRTSFAGYYTVPLSEKVILSAGDTFSVVVTLSKSNGGSISYFVDKTYQNGNWISFVNAVSPGQSFAYTGSGWLDLSATGATARVKAFTNDHLVQTAQLSLSTESMTLWKGETASLRVEIKPENASYQNVIWKSSDSTVVKVTEDGGIHAVTKGTAIITAQAKDNENLTADCEVTVRQQVKQIKASSWELSCKAGEMITLQLTYAPAGAGVDGVSFKSRQTSIATVDAAGTVTAKKSGTAEIQVYSAYNQKLLGTFSVTVTGENEAGAEAPGMVDTSDTVDAAKGTAPRTSQSKPPRTDDETNPSIWVAFLLFSSGILIGELWISRRRNV